MLACSLHACSSTGQAVSSCSVLLGGLLTNFICFLFALKIALKGFCGEGVGRKRDGSLLVFSSTTQNLKLLSGVSRTGSNVWRHSRDGWGCEVNYPLIHKTGFVNLLIFVLSVPLKNYISEVLVQTLLWQNGTAAHMWTSCSKRGKGVICLLIEDGASKQTSKKFGQLSPNTIYLERWEERP